MFVRNFRKCNFENILRDLQDRDIHAFCCALSSPSEVNSYFSNFVSTVQSSVLSNTPLIKVGASFPPWFSSELRRLVLDKRRLHAQYKRTLNDCFYFLFSQVRSQCKELSRTCFKNYINHIQELLPSNPNKFWNCANTLKKNQGSPATLSHNENAVSSDEDKCEMFADFFSSVFTTHNHSSQPGLKTHDSSNLISSCFFTEDDITKALRDLNTHKGCGPDLIPSSVLKYCQALLSSPLQRLFNMSIQHGVFPEALKTSYIVPIHKSGSNAIVSNYRPIAIQSALSKLFEKLVLAKIFPLLQSSISSLQHGFSPGRSPATNLVMFHTDIISSFSQRKQVDAVFLDFSKAFDRVSHPILLSKLSLCGIHGPMLDWFTSYLRERKLMVKFAHTTSREFVATSGVPQGSHLAPVLFNIFINDISRVIRVKHLLFADNVKLYSSIASTSDFQELQNSLSAVERWCEANCMSLNSSKCSVMTFHRTLSPCFYDYTLDGCNLRRVDEVKDLGVMCAVSLSSEHHVNHACAKANRNLGLITRYSRFFTSPLALKALYCHLVRSHLEYCSTVWSPHQLYLQERLQSIQSRFIRLVGLRLGYRYNDVPVDTLANELGLRPLLSRRKVSDLMFLYRLVNGEIHCPELLEQIRFHVPAGTRSRELFARLHHSTVYEQHSTIFRIQATANRLPPEIDIFHSSAIQFKRLISALPQEEVY